MGLKKAWSFRGVALPDSYHRVVGLQLNCRDRQEPVLTIALAIYASLDERNGEKAPLAQALGEVRVTFSRGGITWDNDGEVGESVKISGDEAKAAVEQHISEQVPEIYAALMALPLYTGAEVE